MLKKRNAQGLSITTIILAVIGIIIIVVLIAMFTGRLGIFSEKLKEQSEVSCLNLCTALNMVAESCTNGNKKVRNEPQCCCGSG
tara:strand:+ start:381 stop:632 length:252 start_codon:yes stop_codon:yes gene_type:complete